MKKILLATHNRHKVREMAQIIAAEGLAGYEVFSLDEVGVTEDVEENGVTFEENALIKARAAAHPEYIVVADDSGLEVDALGGAPGIRSARYCEGSDQDRVDFLLKNMETVPEEQRGAQFVSAIACVYPDGTEFVVRGICRGTILHENHGAGGFGYDPVFYVPEEGETFSSMSQERKNAISHRANALALTRTELETRGL